MNRPIPLLPTVLKTFYYTCVSFDPTEIIVCKIWQMTFLFWHHREVGNTLRPRTFLRNTLQDNLNYKWYFSVKTTFNVIRKYKKYLTTDRQTQTHVSLAERLQKVGPTGHEQTVKPKSKINTTVIKVTLTSMSELNIMNRINFEG